MFTLKPSQSLTTVFMIYVGISSFLGKIYPAQSFLKMPRSLPCSAQNIFHKQI